MKLKQVYVKGFKSIDSRGQTIPLGDVTVLLGANGSGKSNLVSFFRMLNFMTTGALQNYVGKQGVSRLLFYGPKVTETISFTLLFSSDDAHDEYEVQLAHGLPGRLFLSGERIKYHAVGRQQPQEYFFESGVSEAGLPNDTRPTSYVIAGLLRKIRAFHFHDTSETAKIKDRGYVDDASYLRSDAGNLAAFLRMLKEHETYSRYYERIVRHVRKIMPQFGDFMLDSIPGQENYVRLNWSDIDQGDYLFDPNQISDGSLRFMALATLLLQPPELCPNFIVLDEPELGLHPAAIAELAGMIKTASRNAQVLVATQSTRFVDEFSLEQLVVVEQDTQTRASRFRKLSVEDLGEWIERYSLSELWEKNVIGGQP